MSALLDAVASPFFRRALVEALVVGGLAGVVGVHVLLRRLPFFVVALSHATFPGVVVAAALGGSIVVGGWIAGVVVVGLVIALGAIRHLDRSTVTGVVLAGAFALGIVVQSAGSSGSKDLSAFLIGSVLTVTTGDLLTAGVVALGVGAVLAALHKELVLSAFDPVGAASLGYRTAFLDAGVLLTVTVVLVTAVPAVGTLLAVALLTVPAMTARQWSQRVGPAMAIAGAVGATSGVVGLLVSAVVGVAAGGAIALVAVTTFAISTGSQELRRLTHQAAVVRSPSTPGTRRPGRWR